ncbi:MAG: hypothetical protein ACKVOE_04920 [Rickettsiales bacterium]
MAKPETTTSYQWDAHSLIRRVDVRQQDNGMAVAYLYADPDPALKDKRLDIRAALRLKGLGTLSDHRGGEFGLRVTGLRSGADLIAALQNEGFVTNAPTQQSSHLDKPEQMPATLWGRIKANSLQWSGILATIGNTMSFASGIHRGKVAGKTDWGQIGQGLAFGVADLPLMIAGSRDDARQLGDFLRRLKTHYEKEGIEIPKTASIYVETSDKGKNFGERAMDFMHRYANQIKCGFEGVAAISTVAAGKNQGSFLKKWAPFVWGPGFIASLLIPEKKIDEEKYAQAGTLGRLWMKVQSNPLVIGGSLGYANVIANYGSAINERKTSLAPGGDGHRLYRWDFAIPTVMIGANGLYAMSKKTVGGDIKSDAILSDAYTVAAQIINKQPEALREKAIESTARFFADRTEIKENHTQVLERLRREIDLQRANPWFEPHGLPNYIPKAQRDGLAHELSPKIANDNDTALKTVFPSTHLAAANDRSLDGITQDLPAQIMGK